MKRCKYYIEKRKNIETDLSYIVVENKEQIYHVYSDGTKIKGHYIGDIHDIWVDVYYIEIPPAELALIV